MDGSIEEFSFDEEKFADFKLKLVNLIYILTIY